MFRILTAARMAGLGGSGGDSSFNELMLKTGLSREQLSQFARDRSGLSSGSLSNLIQRKNSFDALMSLDFQSIQSIDNLANLIQSGGGNGHVPASGMPNADFGGSGSRLNFSSGGSDNQLSNAGRVESLLRGLSNNNFGRDGGSSAANLSSFLQNNGGSGANLSSLLQNSGASNSNLGNFLQNNGGSSAANLNSFLQNNGGGSTANLSNLLQSMQGNLNSLGGNNNGASAASLANLLRPAESSTGLTALRVQDGLNGQRNSSVDDFLSLVAAGDIPAQDPSLLDVPLMHQQQQQQQQQQGSQQDAAKLLAQQQLLQQSNPALANALASRSFGNLEGSGLSTNALAAMVGKRKLDDLGSLIDQQGNQKR